MTSFFQTMNEEYVQKHFPNNSVFEGVAKTLKRRGIGGYFFLGLFFLGSLYGLIWAIRTTLGYLPDDPDDMLGVGIGISVFFGLCALFFGGILIYLIKNSNKKRSGYIADSAKNSKLSVSEIENFERQAVASDCYILKLTAGLDRVLSNATNKDGLLTRDYVYLADPAQIVFRIEDLRACCFSEYTYYIGDGSRRKKIHNLTICLLSSNGACASSDTTEKAGLALMELLKERNPAIDTNDGKVVPEDSFDAYKKKLSGA